LHFADITARRKRLGRRVGTLYSQIAAIARANEMTVATRNVSHFRDCDFPLVDPWAR
jgi:predicted nucleic acid-binding protein